MVLNNPLAGSLSVPSHVKNKDLDSFYRLRREYGRTWGKTLETRSKVKKKPNPCLKGKHLYC